jgi:hypothetical protein
MSVRAREVRTRPTARARESRTKACKPQCSRCRFRVARVVPAYWDPTYRICPTCCLRLAIELDTDNAWPDADQSVSSRNPTRRTHR